MSVDPNSFYEYAREYKSMKLYEKTVELVKEVLSDVVRYDEDVDIQSVGINTALHKLVVDWTSNIDNFNDITDELTRKFYLDHECK